ncbi:MAG: FIST N-terminal domain-containing protein, partial [Actinomycetota bacterium]|nr:FIST N-terminal domain-containing protein [Actinomycetota bacterium]
MPPERVRYAAALSEHPDPGVAIGEVVGQVLDRLGPSPDLAVLFTTGNHAATAPRLARVVRQTLAPEHLVGGTAVAVLAHRQEVEESPGLALWAGRTGPVTTVRYEGPHPEVSVPDGSTIVLVADPFTLDAAEMAAAVGPGVTMVGGLASAGNRPGENRLLLDDEAFTDGGVAVVLPPGLGTRAVVAPGCRPVGDPYVVTGSDGNLLLSLGGRPALERLREVLDAADDQTRDRLRRGLHVGLVIDEHREAYESGDFLVRAVLGADRSSGAVAIGDRAAIGTTVQFQVRDADAATADLRGRLRGLRASGALVFTCNGRGSHLFGSP